MKNIIYFIPALIFVYLVYMFFEPVFTSANTEDTGDPLTGVVQTVSSDISITCDSSTSLLPSITPSATGYAPPSESSVGDLICTVKTNSSAGFSATIKNKDWSEGDVALRHSTESNQKFTNYPATATYNWADPSSGVAYLGFTIGAVPSTDDAADIDVAFKNDGVNCGTGSTVNDSSNMGSANCWRGLNDTTNITILNSSDETDSNGEAFKLRLRARANAKTLKAGTYGTDLTITATL